MNKKRSKKNNYVVIILLLLIIGISIGYAALTANLNINGITTIGKSTWNVHFENIEVTTGSVTATVPATISDDTPTNIDYSIALEKPGDFYEFTVDVKNSGTLAAKLSESPVLSGVSSEQDIFINYTVSYSDNSSITADDSLAAGESKKIKVRVEYDKDIDTTQLPTSEQTLNLNYSMNFVQE